MFEIAVAVAEETRPWGHRGAGLFCLPVDLVNDRCSWRSRSNHADSVGAGAEPNRRGVVG
jgi:hypothetical protein